MTHVSTLQFTETQHSPVSKHLATLVKKYCLLEGRNLRLKTSVQSNSVWKQTQHYIRWNRGGWMLVVSCSQSYLRRTPEGRRLPLENIWAGLHPPVVGISVHQMCDDRVCRSEQIRNKSWWEFDKGVCIHWVWRTHHDNQKSLLCFVF